MIPCSLNNYKLGSSRTCKREKKFEKISKTEFCELFFLATILRRKYYTKKQNLKFLFSKFLLSLSVSVHFVVSSYFHGHAFCKIQNVDKYTIQDIK